MKKLIISLVAFAAMFAFASNASAAVDQGKYVVYDNTNGYSATLVKSDSGDLQLVYETGSGANLVTNVKTGVYSLVGMINIASDDTRFYFTYLTETSTDVGSLTGIQYDIDTGILTEGTLATDIDLTKPIAMSPGVGSNGFPVFLLNQNTGVGDPNDLILLHNNGSWTLANLGIDGPGEKAIMIDGTTAHIAYSDGVVVYAKGYTGGSEIYSYSTTDSYLSAPEKIVAIGTDGTHGEFLIQQGPSDGSDFYTLNYDSGSDPNPAYTRPEISSISTTGQIFYDATRDPDNSAYVVMEFIDEDTNNVMTGVYNIASGAQVGSLTTVYSDSDVVGFAISPQDYNSDVVSMLLTGTEGDYTLWRSDFFTSSTPEIFYELGGGGGAVPELPSNGLWKVLIAVLALGLVVGIAAFMKKKKK